MKKFIIPAAVVAVLGGIAATVTGLICKNRKRVVKEGHNHG